MKFDKDEIKNNLTIAQVFELVSELGGEPMMMNHGSAFTSKTICHNLLGEGSRKLYYYDNTKLFQCYTDCGESFDVFELIRKVKNTREEYKTYYSKEGVLSNREWQLFDAVDFAAVFFNISADFQDAEYTRHRLEDWDVIERYEKRKNLEEPNKVGLTIYDDKILKYLPRPRIVPWEKEGISPEVIKNRGIAFDPRTQSIVIPHYNIDNNLVGIRERTLIKEDEIYGKYKPAILNGKMYNHPLGFNLYNLNNSKNAIKILKKAILFEGEKSPLLYASMFGEENDITVACCGSNLLKNQVQLLLSLGVEEIIIAFDKQFKEIGDDEWKRWTKLLRGIHDKYSQYTTISFIFDKENLLNYKDSPIDQGKETFLKLFERRITL